MEDMNGMTAIKMQRMSRAMGKKNHMTIAIKLIKLITHESADIPEEIIITLPVPVTVAAAVEHETSDPSNDRRIKKKSLHAHQVLKY